MYDISNRQSPECIAQTGQLATTGVRGDGLHSISVKEDVIYSCATTNGLVVHSLTDCVVDGITVKKGGTEIQALEQGTLSVEMTATSYVSTERNINIILALYYNDELENIIVSPVSIDGFASKPISASINVPSANGYRLKVMVWDDTEKMNIKSVDWDGDTAISTGVEMVADSAE